MFEYNASDDEEVTVPETPPAVSDEEEEQEGDCDGFDLGFSPIVTHTVTFKCIDTVKEDRYQETFAHVAQLRNAGQEVLCKLQVEPENPFDSLYVSAVLHHEPAAAAHLFLWQVLTMVISCSLA